jgi:hypothetical protein|tara:strand:- start:2828 stop:2998 length:171 start_codon:yes stop_codon:yes gene_type:complete
MKYHIHGTTREHSRWVHVEAIDYNDALEKAKKILGNDYFIVSVQNYEPRYDNEKRN